MTFVLIAAAAAVLAAVLALARAGRAARRADRISESYWELRYEIGQLKTRIARLESASGLADLDGGNTAPDPGSVPATSFVPLSSLKK